MRYHSEHLKLYFEKNTVLQRRDLQNKSEIKKKLFIQCKYHFPQKMIHLIFKKKHPTYFHNLIYMTNLVRYREYLFNQNGTEQN